MTRNKLIMYGAIAAIVLVSFLIFNPISFNDATERTVVTQVDGNQFVKFTPGMFYAGFFAKEQPWPNQISVSHVDTNFDGDLSINDNTIEIGIIKDARFNDATTATISGITQYILPSTEADMLAIHNAHKTPTSFVQRRLSPYTIECLKSSAQLMSSEAHYSGGRAQMTQDYMEQLRNGSYLLNIKETNAYDSTEKAYKRVYAVQIQKDKNGQPLRKFSSIKEYNVSVGDAQILDVDYEQKVDDMLAKKITAATDASVSKQRLMTAQQQAMTAEAEGKRKLVEIEYTTKQKQTEQVVNANTQVQLAEQDRQKQEIALKGSKLEAEKIKTLADAYAYEKSRAIQADGALEQKLAAYIEVQTVWANAFKDYSGNVTPQIVTGNAGGNINGATNFMDLMGMKAARDLSLDLKTK